MGVGVPCGPGVADGPGVACGTGVADGLGLVVCVWPGLGEAADCTSTSAAKRFAQLSKNAADNKTDLNMGVYATLCPRFRKINLEIFAGRSNAAAARSGSPFFELLSPPRSGNLRRRHV
jgi:hypothetical protein